MVTHLTNIIAAQSYELFDLENMSDDDAHIIVGTQTKVIPPFAPRLVHPWEAIITPSVVVNWCGISTVDVNDFLEIRQAYADFVSTVVQWECANVRRMEDVAERGWPITD